MKIYCKDCKFRIRQTCSHNHRNVLKDYPMERKFKTIFIDDVNKENDCILYKKGVSLLFRLKAMLDSI